ncbi:uncharacterized protein LOC106466017 isoform X2 [Limulus polyphemus]|uniref:Uncharacterized protein LOC106466017 isoform X2 n=1 Tax=Limulus polyphemus TaxID=6850 RepID=A0ABM1T1D1_LIMPO|nr:uncharacterized protein LOC106466017 isoform X2 [Limulus polyphemus]
MVRDTVWRWNGRKGSFFPKVKKTVSAPPVMNNIPKLPVVNGTLPYDVTPVMTPNHGGDDSAINELLEGRMDLDVILPDGKKERVTVERSTQMIDLLVKVTTPYKIKPGGHMIQVFDERGRDLLYKPSTYIGFLDTNTIFVVPKKKPADNKKLTFETSRLQIRLPHNQRIAYRFSPKITLHEIKQTVCREKNLDTTVYHLAHPNQMDVVMDGNMTFENYNFKEICLISSKSMDVNSSQLESIKYPSHNELEQKEKALSFQNNHSTVVPSVDSLSSTVLDNKKSLSTTVRSKFKKGPAPPPPPPPPQKGSKWGTPSSNTTTSKVDRYELDKITHSRHSSDSSGYHEPSLLSEPPTVITTNQVEDFSNHKTISDKKTSTPKENSNIETEERSSLSKPISPSLSVGKKRKAPPPPVQSSCTKANGYVRNLNISQPLSTLTSDSSDQLEFTHPENCMLSENKESSDKHETNLKNTVAIPIDSQDNDKYCIVNTSFFNRNADEIRSFTSNITLHHSNIKSSDLDHSHTLLDYHNSELTRRDLDSCCSVSDTEKGEFIREESDLNSVSDIDEDKVTRGDFDAHSVSDIDEDEMTRGDFNSHSVSNIYEEPLEAVRSSVGLLRHLYPTQNSSLSASLSEVRDIADTTLDTMKPKLTSRKKTGKNVLKAHNLHYMYHNTTKLNDSAEGLGTPDNDNINAATPVNNNINIITPVNDNINTVTPVNDNINTVTPVNDNFNTNTPVNDKYYDKTIQSLGNVQVTTVRKFNDNPISVDDFEIKVTLVDDLDLDEAEGERMSKVDEHHEEFNSLQVSHCHGDTMNTAEDRHEDLRPPPPLPSSKPEAPKRYFSPLPLRREKNTPSPLHQQKMKRKITSSFSTTAGDTSKSSRFVGLLSSLNTISDLDQTFQQTTAKEEQIMAKEHQTGRSKGSCIIKGSDKEADSAHLEPYSRNISDCSQVKRRVKTDIQQPGEILIDQKMKPPALLKEKVSWKATRQNNHCTVNENNTSFKESIKSLSNDNNSQSTLPPTPSSPPPLKAVSDDISVMRNHSERNSENTNGKLIKPNDLSIVAAVRNLRLKNFTIKPYTREEEEDSFSSEAQDFKSTQKYLELNDNPIRNYLEKPFLRAPNKENLQGTDSRENKFKVHKSESFHCQDINSENETKPKLLGCERTGSSQEETNPIIMNPQNNKVVYSGGGSVRGIKGKVRIRCLAIDDQNISSLFNGNTTSMTDLSQQALMEADEQHDDDQQTDFSERLGRVKSEVDGSQYSNVARSEGSIVKVSSDQQNELQDEYQKLQNQLLLYQKKLLDNQELLEKENIMSKFSLSPLTRTKVFFEEQQLLSSDTEELKSEILPKLKPSSVRAAKKDHSSTVDLQSRIHSETLTSAKTKHSDSFNKPTKKNLIHSHLLDEFQPTTDPGKKVVSHENEQETIQNRKQSKELISNKFPWLSLENQLENEDISFKQIYKQLKDNSYKPSNRANQQTTVTKNVAYRTNSLNLEKNSNYFKQDEWLLKQPKTPDTEELNATQSFKNIFAPQPYKSKPISHTFRLPPTKILGAPIVRGFSEEVKSKILESVKFSSVKDTVASNSKEDIPMHEEIAVSPLQQKHAFQLHKTGVGNKFSKSVAAEGNVGAPFLPRTLPSETNEVSSTSNTQVNSFPSRNFDKEPSGSKKLQNANVNSRDQLMMEIKKFGGQNSLKKVPPRQPSWQLRVFGSSSTS